MKTGIVVEGGGMRGIYAAGVLDVLLEHGIKADGLVGVSAGAIHGCSFVAGQAGRSIRYNLKYCRDPRYMSFRSLVMTGDLVGNEFCYHELPERLDPFDNDAFEASLMEFYATCTDVETGKAGIPQMRQPEGGEHTMDQGIRLHASGIQDCGDRRTEAAGRRRIRLHSRSCIPQNGL